MGAKGTVSEDEKARRRAALELADELFDVSEDERAAALASADPDVRAEAMKLLEADAQERALFATPAGAVLPSALTELEPDATSPPQKHRQIGAFRLESLLGKGGMGEVWVATRTNGQFEQKVAVKLPHAVGNAAKLRARFRQERRILARLSHPHIAKLFDGGVTEDGQPWLAMEFVEGLSLTEHCAARELGVEERLRLFLDVCDAVQYLHRNLVIHRDLKPSNILVGADGEPKLLDFGIAKLLENDEPISEAALTRTGDRPMTPDYAAPEQIRGDVATTATDVWALGIILYELLTGVRPYRASGKGIGEVERAILEAAPTRPSSKVLAEDGDPRRPAALGAAALRKRLRGDLDAILLKALRRDPEQRYATPEALAADVRRHQGGMPVLARGDAASYLLRSFVRRYRVAVGFSAIAVAALVLGLAGTLWEAQRAREQARRADEVQKFLFNLLSGFDPQEQGGRPITEYDILARGEERLTRELGERPDVQATLLSAFAKTWLNLGVYERARPACERALALDRKAFGPRSDEEAKTLVILGDIDGIKGDFTTAAASYTLAASIFREREGKDSLAGAHAAGSWGGIKRRLGDFAGAETLYHQQLDIDRKVLGEKDQETANAMANLALTLGDWGRLEEAAELNRRTIALFAEVRGMSHPETLIARHNYARDLLELGHPEEADAVERAVVEETTQVLGERYGQVAAFWRLRGRTLDALGRPVEAIQLYDRSIQRWTEIYGERSTQVAASLERKGAALRHLGRLAEAEAAARLALDIYLANEGDDHVTARTRSILGSALLDEGRPEEARVELAHALAIQEKLLVPIHPDRIATKSELARADAAVAGKH